MTVKATASAEPDWPFAAPLRVLPHGPHELSREQVADSQRTRLMVAITELIAEDGYAAVRLAALVTRAGVSKATFYEHFSDKEQCLLAAYEHYLQTLIAAIVPAAEEELATMTDFVRSVVTRYIGLVMRDLTAARAFFIELESAGPEARSRLRAERQAFAALVARGHEHFRARDPSLVPLPAIAYEAIVDAARDIVRDRLDAEPEPDLAGLIPDLTLTFSAIFEGAAATRAAARAR
jgi:AcrR family transcriptional regulator